MFLNFFSILSPTTIYYRFFSALKILSPAMLERFTQIDYDREISLVALDDSQDEKMLGVARVIGDPDVKKGEFSVLIGDPWHGQGIGATILRRCLQIARDRGMETVWGTVLSENRHMLALGKKLGFTIGKGEDASERKLTIDLRIAEL
jgi:acetyltransferase